MRIIITTCPKYLHLIQDFLQLANQFLRWSIEIDVAKEHESKAEQLERLCNQLPAEYFILLEDDFFLIQPVSMELLIDVYNFCRSHNVDRFSLQSKNAHSFTDWKDTGRSIGRFAVYETVPNVQHSFSLEASIWNRNFLLNQVKGLKLNDGELENTISNKLREEKTPTKIYALDEIVIHYRDAMRGGFDQVIELKHDPWRLVVKPGNELAIYPNGEKKETELCLYC